MVKNNQLALRFGEETKNAIQYTKYWNRESPNAYDADYLNHYFEFLNVVEEDVINRVVCGLMQPTKSNMVSIKQVYHILKNCKTTQRHCTLRKTSRRGLWAEET